MIIISTGPRASECERERVKRECWGVRDRDREGGEGVRKRDWEKERGR